MENNDQHSGNNQSSAMNQSKGNSNSTDITAVIDEVIARVKQILNRFEEVVEEAFTFFEMLRDLVQEVRRLFSLRGEGARNQEYATA